MSSQLRPDGRGSVAVVALIRIDRLRTALRDTHVALLPDLSRDVSSCRIRDLAEKFGGVTAYTRAPAEGTWEDSDGRTHRDDIVTVEVMTEVLDSQWWKA